MKPSIFPIAAAVALTALLGCRSPDQVGPDERLSSEAMQAKAARLLRTSLGRRQPTPVFIDGKRFVRQDGGEGAFNIIDPDRIVSIRLLTGAEAESRAGAAGRGGVIWITTKEAAVR